MTRINPISLNNSKTMFKSTQSNENKKIETSEIIGADYLDEFIPSLTNQRNNTNRSNTLKGFLDNLLKSIQKII